MLAKYSRLARLLTNEYLSVYDCYEYLADEIHSVMLLSTPKIINKFDSTKGCFYPYWKKCVIRDVMRFVQFDEQVNNPYSLDRTTYMNRELHEMISVSSYDSSFDAFLKEMELLIDNPKAGLDKEERQVMKLLIQGYDIKETAQIIGRCLSTAYRLKRTATSKLREVYKDIRK